MGTDFNYDDTSHQVIYDHINGGVGSGALQQVSREWQKLGNEIGSTGKSYVQSVISNILTNRDGAAAQAAVMATGALLPWMDDVTQIAATTAHRTQGQADYWVTAKNGVPPPPPPRKSVGFFSDPGEWAAEKMDWFPGVTSEQEKDEQRRQDAAEQARQAMRVYQTSSNPNLDAAPAFTAPQALDGSVGSLPPTGASVGGSGGSPVMAGGGAPAHLMSAPQPVAHQPVAPPPAGHQLASSAPAATVLQLAQGGPAGAAGSVASPERWAGNSAPNQGMLPGALAAGAGFGGGSTTVRPASASTGARLANAGTSGGGAGRHTAFGPKPSAEFGPRPTASLPPMDEPNGTRGGAGPAGAARNAGAAGYGQPFVGGTGQRGEQDREHRSKYLLHDDLNSIVGDLPPTAPPVIGADY
ncbi:MAG: PPE domain-containing protein [Pseudonocardiaceae bacterium]